VKYKVGAKIQWKWMGRLISGSVKEVYTTPTTQLIKGKSIKRNGSKEKPAYLVESDAGNLALKLETELLPYKKLEKSSRPTPKMFS
jgi:hypothetical protein